MRGAALAIAIFAALGLGGFSIVRGTWAVGGSDSSCYALMADAFARGELQPVLPLAARAPWPDATRTFAPGGFIPSPVRSAAAAPICVPGFSLLMVPLRWLGGVDGIFLLTPLAAGFLVWWTFVAARHVAGDAAGALAAVVVATSPIVLFQTVQPMNDITTAALWAGVVAVAARPAPSRWWLMGALTGIALLVRPNLAPVAFIVGVWVFVESRSFAAALRFSAAAAPGVAVVAGFNWMLYGHPFRVGYGSASDLFSASHIATNVAHYARAALETMTVLPVIAVAAPFVVPPRQRPLVWLSFGVALATVSIYLLYLPFDEWWYLRFLLPAIVAVVVLSSATIALLVRRPLVVAAIALVLAIFGVRTAIERQATDLQRLEGRFRHTGHAVRDRLPSNALLFTVWESGTVRYHAEREAVLWDSLDPAFLEPAMTWVREQGYEPFLVLERWEEPLFRARFSGHTPLGALDWPPRFEVDRQVRIYAPSDRSAYLAGQPVPTEHIVRRER
jgi:hypothetical protein